MWRRGWILAHFAQFVSNERRLTWKIHFREIFGKPIIHAFRVYFHPVDVELYHF